MKGATSAGTARYAARFMSAHFRTVRGWSVSSIGLGTYLGEMDEATDRRYTASALRAFELGCNLFDTAINYRYQRSERNLGEALKKIPRDEIIVATKAGFPSVPDRRAAFAGETDVVGGVHCMTPSYLARQLDTSLKNLGLETIDIFYVHNPETQLEEVPLDEFYRRLRAAFEFLEGRVRAGAVQIYGTATWNGYREEPRMDLEALVRIAREVGGDGHHFRAIQLPFNAAMVEGREAMEAASRHGMMVCSSASILQGKLARRSIGKFAGLTPAQEALQFARSAPGLTCALVGMSTPAHVEENLALARLPP